MQPRIISLVPSSTETLLSLDADVIACTKYCEQPSIPHVGGTKNPDIEAIIALAPDVVVLDREENRIEDHDELVRAGLVVFASDVVDLASALAVEGELAAIAHLERPHRDWHPREFVGERRTAFVPIWRRPWMTISAATYGASLLSSIGIDTLEIGDGAYPTIELDDVAARQPDLVLVPSEPYVFSDDHVAEIAAVLPSATIVRVDGQDLFWWGSRTGGAISRLEAALERPPTP